VFKAFGGADCVHAAEEAAHLLTLLCRVEVRPAAAATWINGEQVTAVLVQCRRFAIDQRCHHRDW